MKDDRCIIIVQNLRKSDSNTYSKTFKSVAYKNNLHINLQHTHLKLK